MTDWTDGVVWVTTRNGVLVRLVLAEGALADGPIEVDIQKLIPIGACVDWRSKSDDT